jgi:MerR family redox-sensitive transcriptional activator SoxR
VLLTILPPAWVVTQAIGYYIYLVRSRSVGKIMDCKADLMAADEIAANKLINIHEMSKRSSVPAATLRYYEKLGLITSERKTSGSHRRYSEATLHRITYITLAQRAGFSLEEIAEQLAMLPNIHPVPPKVWAPLRKKWERRIDQHIAELKQLKIDLRRCTRDASR